MITAFRMALRSISGNKMRAALTMLGIVIGVMTLVVLVSLVNSATDSVTDAAQGWGDDENGLFFHNGRNIPCTLDGEELTMTTSDGITFVFLRQGDLP